MKTKMRMILVVCVAFLVGAFCGALLYANRDIFKSDAMCPNGGFPDENGCCAGEVYTELEGQGFACCPETGENCFLPMR